MGQDKLLEILEETLAYSRVRDYVGWDKHDGLSSRIRQSLPFETKWTNLAFQESVKRAPFNLRPVFLVEQRPSPKGLSLFTIATANTAQITGESIYKSEVRELADRVRTHNLDDTRGFSLYHNHELQGLTKKTPNPTPDVVSTSFGVKALLRVDELSGDEKGENSDAQLALSAVDFIEHELNSQKIGKGIRISYKSTNDTESYTINANALAARLYLDLASRFGNSTFEEMAEGILNYVASQQTETGGWQYTDPPSASHLGMDNYHNGFIIESFLRYQELVDESAYTYVVDRALDFYRHDLYDNDGAPQWDESSRYPRDIHAAAQGIIVFTHAGDHEFARRIIEWTIENLYAGDGRFYYQKRKYYTKKFTLMRWCQAWMAYALSKYLIQEYIN